MAQQISFHKGITLAGGGPFDKNALGAALALAPHAVAADGGADTLAAFGIVPEAVVGDMDSLSSAIPASTHILHVKEQETTDFSKCLAHVEAPFYIGIGFLGGRLDHTLAALSVLLEYREKRVLLLGEEDVAFVVPSPWTVAVEPGTRVSFFPMLPCRGVSSSGLRWPVDGLEMEAGAQVGTSNEATAAHVSARFEPAGVVAILPRACLRAAMESLET